MSPERGCGIHAVSASRIADEPARAGPAGLRPPSLVSPPSGCRFADSCPFARAKCAETPPFDEVRPGRRVACWKVSEGWAS